MSKVFVNIGLSLDGYLAPEGMTMENPGYKNWGAKWGALVTWLLNKQCFRENLKFGPGGDGTRLHVKLLAIRRTHRLQSPM